VSGIGKALCSMDVVRVAQVLLPAALAAVLTAPATAAQPGTDRYGDPLPAGAVARLGSARFLHSGSPQPVAFSPDGKALLTSAREPFFRVWDVTTGREMRRFMLKGLTPDRVAPSPDGRWIASTNDDGTVTVWDAATGKQRFSRGLGPDNWMAPLAWAPDGKALAVGVQSRVIYLLGAARGETLRQFAKGPKEQLERLVFTPDGKLLLSAAHGQSPRVWDVESGKLLRTLDSGPDSRLCIAFSPDGNTAAAGEPFALWDVASGKLIRKLPAWNVNSAAFSPDGKIVAACCHRLIHLIDPGTGKLVREWRVREDHGGALLFSRDGKVLASGAADQRVHLWDVATGKELHPAPGHCGAVLKVAFSPGGRTVASGGVDRTIRFWDWATGREWSRSDDIGEVGERRPVLGLYYSPDGKRLVSVESSSLNRAERGEGWGWRTAEVIRLWDAATGRMLSRHINKEVDEIEAIAFLADCQPMAVTLKDGCLGLWQPGAGNSVRRLGKSEEPPPVVQSPDGKYIAWATRQGRLKVRDLATGEGPHTFTSAEFAREGNFALNRISLAFSPDGSVLALTGATAAVGFWDVATGRKLGEWQKDHGDIATPLAFSPEGAILAAAVDREVWLWDLRTGEEIRRFTGHQGAVNAIAFAPDGRALVSASSDGTLLVWDMTGRMQGGRLVLTPLRPEELEKQWVALGAADAARRWHAVWTLAAYPQATSFLAEKVRPVPAVPEGRIKQLVADLDADAFAVREKASRQLADLGEVAGPALRAVLASGPSVEARRRIEELLGPLERLDAVPLPERRLRALGGVTVLEYVGNKDARVVLETLARGACQARLTLEAKKALVRLGRRPLARR
jgi:WD40 repeat protein